MRKISLVIVTVLAVLAAPGTAAAEAALDQRLAAVGAAVDKADDTFRGAMKGHLPSLEAINALRARMTLAKGLYQDARAAAEGGKTYDAAARLDAAEFLAGQVYEGAKY